jgi:hypothetical protein
MSPSSRTVRVFLSSTFRDFAEERDLLVRKVFPELRRKCRQRQVELVDVDLRWGITEKEAQRGKVLPICMAEIDRSRPFFMGFIGERYGWIPEKDQYDLSLILEQPWLDEHRGGKSVTELEMLHGVLNNPAMEDRAFFYFRDTAYSRNKGGAYMSEGPAERAKLEALKDRIRTSGFPVVEDYPTPEALAERVKKDLWKLIDEAFPESEVPDALTQERLRHETYGAARRRLYFAGEDYFRTLDAAMKAKRFQPVLITGQSGAGKSALLANWMARWSKTHPKTEVITHHLGCGTDAADPVRMVTRLMQEIARLTGEEFKPETSAEKTLEQLSEALALASAWAQRNKRELLIVLDGLDKLSGGQHLRWIPAGLPPKVKLVISGLEGVVMEAARRRLEWVELTVKPFTRGEQTRFIKEYLGRYRKSLTGPQGKTLQAHPLCGNPLFLLTVLEELRVFGVHEVLEERLSTLLSPPPNKAKNEAPTVDDVFEHVLSRIEADLGKKAIRSAMEVIWASRQGLYIDEILEIAKLTPSRFASILIALDESLYENGGRICFGNHYLRKAVEDRYIATPRRATAIHGKLGDFFGSLMKNRDGSEERGYMEVLYHFIEANRLQDAEEIFCDFSYLINKLRFGGEAMNDAAALDSLLLDCLKLQSRKPALSPRLTYWVDFISSNSHMLQRGKYAWPAYKILLQVAAEDFENSPISQAADSWLDTGECNWLWLRRLDRPASNLPRMAKPKVFETRVVGAVQTSPASLLSWDLEEMKLWDISSGNHQTVPRAPKSGFMSHDSTEFIAVFEDGVAWIDPIWGEPLTDFKYEGGKLDGGILLVSGDVLTWCDKDEEAQIWTRSGLAGSWKELWMPQTCVNEEIASFRGYLPLDDNRLLFWGDLSGLVRVWNLAKRCVEQQWTPFKESSYIETGWSTFSVQKLGSGNLISHEYFEDGITVRLWEPDHFGLISEHLIDMKLEFNGVLPLNGNKIFVFNHDLSSGDSISYIFDFDSCAKRNVDTPKLLGARLLKSGLIAAWTLEVGTGRALYFFDIEGKNIGSIGTAHHDVDYFGIAAVQDCLTGLALSYSRADQMIKLWSWQDLEKHSGATVSETIFPATTDPVVYAEEPGIYFLTDRPRPGMRYPFDDGLQLAWTASPNFDDPAGVARIKAPEGNDPGTVEIAFLNCFEVSSLQVLWNGVQLNCYCTYHDGANFRDVYCRILEPPQSFSKGKATFNKEDVCGIRLESDSKSVKLFGAQVFETWDRPGYPRPSAQWEAEKAYRLRGVDSDGCILLESFYDGGVKLKVFSGAKPLQADEVLGLATGSQMLKRKIKNILDTLNERERAVLDKRFGHIDSSSRTLEEAGSTFHETREKIRQIEANVLRKMRHPTRIRSLEGFLDMKAISSPDEEAGPTDSQKQILNSPAKDARLTGLQKQINALRKMRNSTGSTQLEHFLEMSFRDLKPEDMLPPTEESGLTELIRQNIDGDLESDPM